MQSSPSNYATKFGFVHFDDGEPVALRRTQSLDASWTVPDCAVSNLEVEDVKAKSKTCVVLRNLLARYCPNASAVAQAVQELGFPIEYVRLHHTRSAGQHSMFAFIDFSSEEAAQRFHSLMRRKSRRKFAGRAIRAYEVRYAYARDEKNLVPLNNSQMTPNEQIWVA